MVREVDAALQQFDSQTAGRLIAEVIDDLSNWYVRRSRRRFWDGDPAALQTLHRCLRDVLLVMAPFTPFITERLWQDLFAGSEHADSIHLASWPQVDEAAIDPDLELQMALVRRLVELGRAARAESGFKVRQPLSRALVAASGWEALPEQARTQIAEELNVVSLESLADAGALVHVSVKPNFRSLGKRFGKRTPVVAAAISAAEPGALVAQVRKGEGAVEVEGDTIAVGEDDVIITEVPEAGWTVASAGGESVALDLHLTDDLRVLGMARDVVRALQQARKDSGFAVTDRVMLLWQSEDPHVVQAFEQHGHMIAAEILAQEIVQATAPASLHLDEPAMRVALRRA
jgi:isoleucyl-tRNA synthetase